VPEAAVDEQGDARPAEHDVGSPAPVGAGRCDIHEVAQPPAVQRQVLRITLEVAAELAPGAGPRST
jgi:hypothetical protein